MRTLVRSVAFAAACGLAGCVGAPAGPYGYAPPGYPAAGYAPPSGYAPAAGYAPAGGGTQIALGGRCFAGVYTCELAQGLPVGSQCSCPGLGAPSFGVVR